MLNRITLIGNLGGEVEMRYTPNGNAVSTFSLAANRTYKDASGERRQETEWFRIVTWNQLAEACNQYLAKGRRAYVEGRVHLSTWDKQDGTTGARIEVIADRVLFLDKASEREEAGSASHHDEYTSADDLPW